jgi:hypothetical protein
MLMFWNSVTVLRRIEFITLVVMMAAPILCGTVLLSVRYRIKSLLNQTNVSQGLTYEENVQRLETSNHELRRDLEKATRELSGLRDLTAPRLITESQQNLIIDKLRGVPSAPVLVSAYAFEAESAAYAAAITAVLRKAGWQATMNKSSMNDFKGVSLGAVNAMNRTISGEHELAQAFAAARIEVHQRQIAPDSIAGQLQDGSLLVVVGRK